MRPYPHFYESLNKALVALHDTGTIELELDKPLYLAEVRALSFRLSRRGRVDKVRTFKMRCEFHSEEEEECLTELEELMSKMQNLDGVFLSNLSCEGCGRVLRGCQSATLTRLAIGCNVSVVGSGIRPATLLDLNSPQKLEKLGIGYIDGSLMDGFVSALSLMSSLRELVLGLGHGTTVKSCNFLFDCIAEMKCLQALYLWAPEEADFQLSTVSSLCRINKIIGKGLVKILSLEDLPGLFEDRKSKAFTEFMDGIRQNNNLSELTFEGNLGLDEEATMSIFKALETNTHLKDLQIRDISLSQEGWKSIVKSLSRNQFLSSLCMRTTTPGDTAEMNRCMISQIIHGLRKNPSLTGLSCFIDSQWHFCTNSDKTLMSLSDRNRRITVARNLVPSGPSFPTSLLPRALARILSTPLSRNDGSKETEAPIKDPCYAAAFPLIQNFASSLSKYETCGSAFPLWASKKNKKRMRGSHRSAVINPTRAQPDGEGKHHCRIRKSKT